MNCTQLQGTQFLKYLVLQAEELLFLLSSEYQFNLELSREFWLILSLPQEPRDKSESTGKGISPILRVSGPPFDVWTIAFIVIDLESIFI